MTSSEKKNLLPNVPDVVKKHEGTSYEATFNVASRIMQEGFGITLRLLSPIAPHVTQYLWRELGYGDDILAAQWPQPDEQALVRDTVDLVIQVNGKLRGRIAVAADAAKETIEQAALAEENVHRFVAGKAVKKIVVVPGRLVNIVVQN